MALKPFKKTSRTFHLYQCQKGICWICGLPMDIPQYGKNPIKTTVTIDHVVPKEHGGKNGMNNLKAAHSFCNVMRGGNGHMVTSELKELCREKILFYRKNGMKLITGKLRKPTEDEIASQRTRAKRLQKLAERQKIRKRCYAVRRAFESMMSAYNKIVISA